MEVPQAHVYALVYDGARCYVGSTCETLHSRLVRHRWRALTNERPHSRLYRYMAERGPENFHTELIATVPLEDRMRTEAQYIRSHGLLNRQVPGRTRAEWVQDRREARAFLATLAPQALVPPVD